MERAPLYPAVVACFFAAAYNLATVIPHDLTPGWLRGVVAVGWFYWGGNYLLIAIRRWRSAK